MAGGRLLTEKVHRQGSPLRESWPNGMMQVVNPMKDHIEDKLMENELKASSNKKSERTPIKMLLAKEMLKETESRPKPPNLVAKLMGLDDLPTQQPVSGAQQSFQESFWGNASTKMGSTAKHQKENCLTDEQMHTHLSKACPQEPPKFKDLHEVWQQVQEINISKDDLQLKGRYKLSPDEKIALVYRKFFEAEHLVKDEKFHQDAMGMLSLNRDLFLEFLQEPRSLFTTHFCELHSIPPLPQTKCITILKPSVTVETNSCAGQRMRSESQSKKVLETTKWDKKKTKLPSTFACDSVGNVPQPTRIVVLKPSQGRTHVVKPVVPPSSSSSIPLQNRDVCCKELTGGARDSTEADKDITQQAQECVSSDKRGDALPSSASSNRYTGERSFLNKSENEFIEEDKLSDSGNATPNSRHSNFVYRSNSPYSSSSLSQVSFSPESAVTREAKRRLSERLEMMKLNGNNEEKRQRSSLGEMLALPGLTKTRSNKNYVNQGPSISSSRSCSGEQELRRPFACLPIGRNGEQDEKYSPKNLLRSKSVPVSSTVFQKVRLSVENPVLTDQKLIILKESVKPKSGKLFKGKLSSLLFSRNKRPSKEKISPHPSLDSSDECQSSIAAMQGLLPGINPLSVENRSIDIAECSSDDGHEAKLPLNVCGPLDESSICVPIKESNVSSEEVLTLVKNGMPENSSEKQEQPSPISVLEAPFEDNSNLLQSENLITDYPGSPIGAHMKSQMNPTCIESSAACLLSRDKDSTETSIATALEPSVASPRANEEGEWYWFAQTLLTFVGSGHRKSGSLSETWHSPESPLDPALLDKLIGQSEDKELQDENKCQQQRSEQRLVFDAINAALRDISGSRFNTNPWAQPCYKRVLKGAPVIEEVWNQMRGWFSIEGKWFSGESDPCMPIERAVNEEFEGKKWEELMKLEADWIGMEIEVKILEELVIDALAVLTCK